MVAIDFKYFIDKISVLMQIKNTVMMKIFFECLSNKKLGLFLISFLMVGVNSLWAQTMVQGKVKDTNGEELIGVNVSVKGTLQGTVTNVTGDFQLSVPNRDDALVFSYVGYETQTVALAGKTYLDVVMQEDSKSLNEVVVTALGIKRAEKSLTYATQQISGKELTEVPSSNMLSNLAGKTAGMTVSN